MLEATFLNLIITWTLVGLIWVIQLVHYPTFNFIEEASFLAFHKHHTASITVIVMPLMLVELVLGFYLARQFQWFYLLPLLLVFLIWLSTFLIQVPIHNQLGSGKDAVLIQKLVKTNWIRTILWTTKAIWISYYFIRIPVK